MEPHWGVDIKFNEFLTSTLDRASVLFLSPVSLLPRKVPSEITKEGVEIWYGGIQQTYVHIDCVRSIICNSQVYGHNDGEHLRQAYIKFVTKKKMFTPVKQITLIREE